MANNNMNLNDTKGMQYISLGIIAVVGFLVLIIVSYVVLGFDDKKRNPTTTPSVTNGHSNNNKSSDVLPVNDSQPELHMSDRTGEKQVFNVSNNLFTFDDAEAVCGAFGAELATYEQLVEAHKKGANWCNYGWTKGQMALYPIQEEYHQKMMENDPDGRDECGEPGINGGYFENKNLMFGVNCYGKKRPPQGGERVKREYISDKERKLRDKISLYKKKLNSFNLAPYNEDKWSSCSK
jgi:hypothetical protein